MRRRDPLRGRILRFAREHHLVKRNEPLVVGVSGGPDSVCLVHVLADLKKTLGASLHIAHLNHMLRGSESDGDADYVSSLARELGIPATIESHDVRAHQRKHRLTLEEAARQVRYALFSEVALSLGGDTVAVGHTADDQVETVLMHLVRGTGLAGLRGMQPLAVHSFYEGTELMIARPLLEVRREDTKAYCAAKGLAPRRDSSNQWPNQLRNQVRSQLIPSLRGYNPDIDKVLLRIARAAGAALDYMDEEVASLWGSAAKEQPQGIVIDKVGFSKLHPAVKRHLVRSALQRLLGDLRDIESVHIESLLEAMAKPAGKRLSLPRGIAFYSEYGHGLMTTANTLPCPYPPFHGEYRLNVPGENEFCGWRVRSTILDRRPAAENGQDKLSALLDLDAAGQELTVRSRRQGDRFQPLGMEVPKKLQDFMVDAKIPQPWRSRVPVVCSLQHIVWVVGWRIDHRARVTSSTKRVLSLEFERKAEA